MPTKTNSESQAVASIVVNSTKQTRCIRFWASLDLLFTGLLATPLTAQGFISTAYWVNGLMGGSAVAPTFDPLHGLFVCFTGGLGVLWALVRIRYPSRELGIADTIARIWMAGLISYFVFVEGIGVVFLFFVATELAGAIHQWLRLYKPQAV